MPEIRPVRARDEIRIGVGAAEMVAAHRSAIRRLYDEVFLGPPFVYAENAPAEHGARLTRLPSRPGFGIAVATHRGSLVGFAYGFPLPADHRWWEGFPSPLPRKFTREWQGRTCTVEDLAVAAGYRRRGIGRRLLAALLAERDEERAVLSVQPAASAAHALYTATGWHLLGRKGPMPGVVPSHWDIYTKRLRGRFRR